MAKKLSKETIDRIRELKYNNKMKTRKISEELTISASSVSKYAPVSSRKKTRRVNKPIQVKVKSSYGLSQAILWLLKEATKEEKEIIIKIIAKL